VIQDSYQTITATATEEIKVSNSRFIASAFPVTAKEEAENFLKQVRKEFYDATHNCFAYRIGINGEVFRYSDDGEPSGTAGVKIFNAIQSKNVSDILVVVTRYFGGTKLGVGGLSRAYFDSAMNVLNKVGIIEKILMDELSIKFPYDFTSQVMHTILKYEVKVVDTVYEADVKMILNIRKRLTGDFKAELMDVCRGNVELLIKNEE
jgi:uncharacterized YigZ family protein